MVQRNIKVPKHGGPDGQGFPERAFVELLVMVDDVRVGDWDVSVAMELCLGAATQQEWNEKYRPELLKRCVASTQ